MPNKNLTKLKETIAADGVKIIELYNKIENNILIPQPEFQRKLVWKKQHKYAFIETILLNYPFPEVYVASSEMDIENMRATEVVVDGQQRLTTIVEYIKGEGDFKKQNKVTPFDNLDASDKKDFLNYKVSVKDLKNIDEELITEIFQRINSTEFSLNAVEKNNAQYGDGEIAIFTKQLVDSDYAVNEELTDVIIDLELRKKINSFFIDNKVFTENDIKRMYDFQYVMLLISTIIEGVYYGRSSKVDEYLEKYNSSFEKSKLVLASLSKSIEIINKIGFSPKSYWFNKANLFTLLVELSKCDTNKLDNELLELELLDLEDKVDIYFMAEDDSEIGQISESERKYFEVARQGSHEKSARDHRGKVISDIIDKCIIYKSDTAETLIDKNIHYLDDHKLDFAKIIPTETGLKKSIMDATMPVREFLFLSDIHDYDSQINGPSGKVIIEGNYITESGLESTKISMYKATKRGDARIWLTGLTKQVAENETLALLVKNEVVYAININRIEVENLNKFKSIFEIK